MRRPTRALFSSNLARASAIAGADVAEPGGDALGRGRLRVERAVADRARDLRMRVAERHALGDERLRGVGREQGRVGGGALQPLLDELDVPHQHGERAEHRRTSRRAANAAGLSSPRSEL